MDFTPFPVATAHVATDRPGRYGKQLATHLGRKITATWNEETQTGRLIFDRDGAASGYLNMRTEENTLLLELFAHADSQDALQHIVGSHLERFGAKDDLQVEWIPTT